jgi:UTP--glucose-1-phosphate uridylyltransferase
MTPKRVRKAVFPVGGLGTRFLPATKAIPKEMLPVVDRPLIQYAVEEAIEAGIEQMIFVTGRGKAAIEDHFDIAFELETTMSGRGKSLDILGRTRLKPGAVAYVRQQEPMGLGHAVWCARDVVGDEPFAVLLADDFMVGRPGCLKQMIDELRIAMIGTGYVGLVSGACFSDFGHEVVCVDKDARKIERAEPEGDADLRARP